MPWWRIGPNRRLAQQTAHPQILAVLNPMITDLGLGGRTIGLLQRCARVWADLRGGGPLIVFSEDTITYAGV